VGRGGLLVLRQGHRGAISILSQRLRRFALGCIRLLARRRRAVDALSAEIGQVHYAQWQPLSRRETLRQRVQPGATSLSRKRRHLDERALPIRIANRTNHARGTPATGGTHRERGGARGGWREQGLPQWPRRALVVHLAGQGQEPRREVGHQGCKRRHRYVAI